MGRGDGRRGLTQQDNDAQQDGDDGAGAQACRNDAFLVRADAIVVALAHLDAQVGGVGHGQVAGVSDDDGDVVNAALKEVEAKAHLSSVT